MNRSLHSGQGGGQLKAQLHRYIIEQLEEESDNLLEGPRPSLVRFVSAKVGEYTRQAQFAISRYETDRLTEELVDELVGFGPLEVLLRDRTVSEILVNGPQRIFIERNGVLQHSDLRFMDDQHLLRVIQRILAPLGRRLDESSPMVDARMPDGSRINAVIPPVALDGPCLSVRKFSRDMLKSTDLLASRSLDQAILDFFK
ncbi:MAG: CpaF family protein, partial [Gammaproteobacteria bacterium]|nr:CpaF family protein [Gammaproteobacteria bacterium]